MFGICIDPMEPLTLGIFHHTTWGHNPKRRAQQGLGEVYGAEGKGLGCICEV